MLALTRKPKESLIIGGVIKVKVVEINGQSVKLAIEAPREVLVIREEIWAAPGVGRTEARGTVRSAHG